MSFGNSAFCRSLVVRVALAGTNLKLRCVYELQRELGTTLSDPGRDIAGVRKSASSSRQSS
jgi:hypothetical protein